MCSPSPTGHHGPLVFVQCHQCPLHCHKQGLVLQGCPHGHGELTPRLERPPLGSTWVNRCQLIRQLLGSTGFNVVGQLGSTVGQMQRSTGDSVVEQMGPNYQVSSGVDCGEYVDQLGSNDKSTRVNWGQPIPVERVCTPLLRYQRTATPDGSTPGRSSAPKRRSSRLCRTRPPAQTSASRATPYDTLNHR